MSTSRTEVGADGNVGSVRRASVRVAAYMAIGGFIYVAFCLAVLAFAAIMVQKRVFFSTEVLRAYQRVYYLGGIRRYWQTDPECVVFDPDLLYKPKLGECKFANPEFATTLHFDEKGRVSEHPSEGVGIAVLGDSHAMGWGVEDDETFSALLEKKTHRPVYNLGVSSYETYRELIRLEKSGLIDKVDTIIIQYCDNDLPPNEYFVAHSSATARVRYAPKDLEPLMIPRQTHPASYTIVSGWVEESLTIPPKWLRYRLSPRKNGGFFRFLLEPGFPPDYFDFRTHYGPLNKILAEFPWIGSKRLIIFYSNLGGIKFDHFSDAIRQPASISGATFIDLDTNPEFFFVIDDHPNRRGQQEIADKLFPLVAK
jgi:hypothetical protein